MSGEFLTMKITPRTLTIEEYVAGVNIKQVFDFKTGKWTVYRSLAAKIDVGIQVGPLSLGVKARADFLESWDTIDLRAGKIIEGGSRFMTGSAESAAGPVKSGRGVEVALDPAAESEWAIKPGESSLHLEHESEHKGETKKNVK